MEPSSIPAFLSFDVEPDGFQLDRSDPPSWTGYEASVMYATRLRTDLLDQTSRVPRFDWYVRTDRQIAEVHGRADHALVAFPRCVDRIRAAGDYWDVHAHPLHGDEARGQWVHDFSDGEWQGSATRFALEAFGEWAGTPVRRFRAGAAFLSNRIVEAADRAGVLADLSLEPVTGWAVGATIGPSAVDETTAVGIYPDCGGAPREPYRPAHRDFRVDGGRHGRRLLMIPLTTRSLVPPHPWWGWAARRVLRGPGAARGRGALSGRGVGQRGRTLGHRGAAPAVDGPAVPVTRGPHRRARLRGGGAGAPRPGRAAVTSPGRVPALRGSAGHLSRDRAHAPLSRRRSSC